MATLKIVNCEIPTISGFVNKIEKEKQGNISSLEAAQRKRNRAVVIGKIVNVTASDEQEITVLIKEVLPNCEYGQKFDAVIKGDLAKSFKTFKPTCGDRVGFYEPFIFLNPDFCDKNKLGAIRRKKFTLEIGATKESLMWCSKKQPDIIQEPALHPNSCGKLENTLQKSNEKDKKRNVQQNSISSTIVSPVKDLENHTSTNRSRVIQRSKSNQIPEKPSEVIQQQNEKLQVAKTPPKVMKQNQNNQVSKVQSVSKDVIAGEFVYKDIATIKSEFVPNKQIRDKMFVIVQEIVKPLTTLRNTKYTMICNISDKSSYGLESMRLHFFTPSSEVIDEIRQGDILCLKRVCLEMFQGTVDGRVYSNGEVLLVRNTPQDTDPIVKTDKWSLTDAEMNIVQDLKKWYEEYLAEECKDVVAIESITKGGDYKIACKVVAQPTIEGQKLILKATDGSSTKHLASSTSLERIDNIVTDIEVCGHKDAFLLLKPEHFLLLYDVVAVHTEALRLLIGRKHYPQKLDLRSPSVKEITRKIERMAKEKQIVEKECRRNEAQKYQTKFVEKDNMENKDKDDIEEDVMVLGVLNSSKDASTPQVSKHCPKNKLSNQNKDTSPTRERACRKRPVKEPLFSPCLHKSCTKDFPEKVVNRNEENKDTERSPENCNEKKRKPLFNANYGDLSDATDEASISQDPKTQADIWNSESVITPTNTSFVQLMKIVKAKYCSPRKMCSIDLKHDQANVVPKPQPTNSTHEDDSKGIKENTENNLIPVVKLVKLSDNCQNNGEIQNLIEQEVSVGKANAKKRAVEETVLASMEDADTVVNFKTQEKDDTRKKRVRLESESTVLGDLGNQDMKASSKHPVVISPHVDSQESSNKVTTWLHHSETMGEGDDEVMADETIMNVQLGREDSLDLSAYITIPYKRLNVFLVRTIPEPTSFPLDLVSGYCHSGCKEIFLFSTIHWNYNEEENIPLCPSCYMLNVENELELMLMFELQVMDVFGSHETLLVCREHAEEFLSCSALEYVMDLEVRNSRIQLLADYTINHYQERTRTPKMDLLVVVQKNVLSVVYSKLQLPLTV